MASDERFETIIRYWLDWGWQLDIIMDRGMRYGLIFLSCSWVAAMILRGSILQRGFPTVTAPQLPSWRLGTIEIIIMLTMINLLFLSFIAVQFTYFFGGEALVQSPDGPTYANYARRGFFQLALVAWLVISLLLSLHWLHKPASKLGQLGYQVLAGVMVVVTMIIESSAAHRMYLYTSVYGLTELRFYTSVFMGWLVILFIWFGFTVLRGQHERFTFGSLLTGLLTIACLHFANPDALIAQVNLSRLQTGERFDTKYITSLSADAIPAILAALPTVPATPGCQLWQLLQFHPALITPDHWRSWNWSRYQARQFLQAFPPDCK